MGLGMRVLPAIVMFLACSMQALPYGCLHYPYTGSLPLSDIKRCIMMTLSLDLMIYQAIVKSVSLLPEPGICLSCTFLAGSTGDGCAVRLQNDQHTFIFNTSRHDNEALECFLVPDTGVYSVHVYDVQYGEVQKHTSRLLDQVIIEKRDGEYYREYRDNYML